MRRCLYRGIHGMQRWVGLSVIADNVIQIGRAVSPCRGRELDYPSVLSIELSGAEVNREDDSVSPARDQSRRKPHFCDGK